MAAHGQICPHAQSSSVEKPQTPPVNPNYTLMMDVAHPSTQDFPMPRPEPLPAQPVADTERLVGMDIARGFALLGIFMVNIQTFGEPFGRFLMPGPEAGGVLTSACYYLGRIFCEGKFYPLFSMLFGMGMMLQMSGVERRGGRFAPLYLRRLAILMVIGFLHATLLWYGDILFFYSICGLILFLCRRFEGRWLLLAGVVMIALSTFMVGAMGALGAFGNQRAQMNAPITIVDVQQDVAAGGAAAPSSPFARWLKAYGNREIQGGPEHPLYIELETRAYRDGGFLDALGFRVVTWLAFLVMMLLGMGWHIAGMFFIGAAMIKLGVFAPGAAAVRTRLLVIGLVIGLPGSILASVVPMMGDGMLLAAAPLVLTFICGPLLSLTYLMIAVRIAATATLRPLAAMFAATGRMALTNYLMQTIIATSVFYWWGFAQFGQWTRPERCAFVLAVFVAQCVFSVIWMRLFRFGPMEWVWRSLTYLRREPMLRRS